MAHVLLVIGSVTSQQYEQARLRLLQKGLKPQIVRVPSRMVPGSGGLILSDVVDQFWAAGLDEETLEERELDKGDFAREFFRRLAGHDLDEVAGLVYDESAHLDEELVYVNLDTFGGFDGVYIQTDVRYLVHSDGWVEQM